jgi:hypothetical protein
MTSNENYNRNGPQFASSPPKEIGGGELTNTASLPVRRSYASELANYEFSNIYEVLVEFSSPFWPLRLGD